MCDFSGVIVFLSIMCPKSITRVKKNFDLSGTASVISFYNI